jgi:hypothetical protein
MVKPGLMTMACLSLAIGAAHAQTAPAQDTAAVPKKSADDRMICRDDDEIGSRVHKQRICLTAAQWRRANQENGQEFERHVAQRSGLSTR